MTRTLRRLRGGTYQPAAYRLRVPACRVRYAPEAQGGLPPGPHVLYALGTRTRLARTGRAAFPGYHPRRGLRELVISRQLSRNLRTYLERLLGPVN